MRLRRVALGIGLALTLTAAMAAEGFSQSQPAQNRIPQPIIVNGQPANGAYVQNAGGGMQSYTCPNPQPYTTPDGASSGWACYDQATSTYLLNALPPAQPQAAPQPQPQPAPAPAPQQQPTVVYQPVYQPAPTVVYTAPPYPVYVAPPYYGPSFVFGFGFGPRVFYPYSFVRFRR